MCETADPRHLLDWYDTHARDLPWRVPPAARAAGVRPDPYRVWLSEIMLQQTTVAAVRAYFDRFTARWPTVGDLARAEDAEVMGEWAGLGYYARARNLLKCARTVAVDHAGRFPTTREGLQALPGIGPYTSAAIAAIAFDAPETVVDGNVERVMARLHDIHTPLPSAKPELTARAAALTPDHRPGDYAQAVMDLGATICTPRAPACGICPWMRACAARAAGTAADLPRKSPKKAKPIRFGIAYVAQRSDGALLLETRPDRGLLGGMLGWPGSDWSEAPSPAPPLAANWVELPEEARHTFTHFHLRLRVMVAQVDMTAAPEIGEFHLLPGFRPSKLPTIMRKVFDLARGALREMV
ncbi:A/G-specific adenine glycosylase [Roseovarius sp. SCSIO 43702]|uniref:A/G-specific adenine glycosylase n=1 Tax=Roseovarius sp. SCSIO 43702 TaxID=2823043 RepID=UPI001C72D950|nr:A/G-specific adenine glycosylase [Roseovarius sp. SCSIO 43702]QYX56899.1 A/G-specific adenine glycosylase [Roseovarius sp. SCSIO 43702]